MEILREKLYAIELAVKEVTSSIWERVEILKNITDQFFARKHQDHNLRLTHPVDEPRKLLLI